MTAIQTVYRTYTRADGRVWRHRQEMHLRRARRGARVSHVRWVKEVRRAGTDGRPYLRVTGYLGGRRVRP
jgi:hypothetical protein